MSTFSRRSLRILGVWFSIVLVACGTSNRSTACYPLKEIEQHGEVAFLPSDTMRLNYEASNDEPLEQSPYRGVVEIVMGSMQNTSTFFQAYSDYLQQQGWTQNIANADEIMWSKDALTLRIMVVDPKNRRDIPSSSKQAHRAWYVLLFGELKGSECPTGISQAE